MKVIKEISKYIVIFIASLLILITLLTLAASIPKSYIEENMKNSIGFFEENEMEITRVNRNKEYTYLHPYADGMILNIIYCLDTENPLSSVIEAKYYTKQEEYSSNPQLIELIENDLEGTHEYLRYWHGSITIIKPLLILFSIEEIYVVAAVVLALFIILLLAILIKKKYYAIAIALAIGLIMTATWVVPFTLEYYWTYLIMLITSIIAVCIESKNKEKSNQKLYKLFFLTGIVTCFFDFLSTELITILVPLLIVLTIRLKNKKEEKTKEQITFFISSIALWGIAYVGMWLAKWLISAIILNKNVIDLIIPNALVRINGQVSTYSTAQLIILALEKNFKNLYIINFVKYKNWIILLGAGILLLVAIMIIDRKNKEKLKYMVEMIIIALIPYLRYIILSNHSYKHAFFTFRSQLPTIMCIVLILVCCTDKNKLLSEVKTKKNKKEIHNTLDTMKIKHKKENKR